MTAQEKSNIQHFLDNIPEDMTQEEFAEDIMLSSIAMRRMAEPTEGDISSEELLKEMDSWK